MNRDPMICTFDEQIINALTAERVGDGDIQLVLVIGKYGNVDVIRQPDTRLVLTKLKDNEEIELQELYESESPQQTSQSPGLVRKASPSSPKDKNTIINALTENKPSHAHTTMEWDAYSSSGCIKIDGYRINC